MIPSTVLKSLWRSWTTPPSLPPGWRKFDLKFYFFITYNQTHKHKCWKHTKS